MDFLKFESLALRFSDEIYNMDYFFVQWDLDLNLEQGHFAQGVGSTFDAFIQLHYSSSLDVSRLQPA